MCGVGLGLCERTEFLIKPNYLCRASGVQITVCIGDCILDAFISLFPANTPFLDAFISYLQPIHLFW